MINQDLDNPKSPFSIQALVGLGRGAFPVGRGGGTSVPLGCSSRFPCPSSVGLGGGGTSELGGGGGISVPVGRSSRFSLPSDVGLGGGGPSEFRGGSSVPLGGGGGSSVPVGTWSRFWPSSVPLGGGSSVPVGGGGGGIEDKSVGTGKNVSNHGPVPDSCSENEVPGAGGAPATRPAAIRVVMTDEIFIVMMEL